MKKEKFKYFGSFETKAMDDGDIIIKGYASTFSKSPDRQGDIIDPTAFDESLKEYMTNPILLADHRNETKCAVGKVIKAELNSWGLKIEAKLSSSMDEFCQSIRTKVKEGILQTLSIGGMFYYDAKKIMKIKLYEISIVTIPANPEASFSLKSLDQILDEVINQEEGNRTGEQTESSESEKLLDLLAQSISAGNLKAARIYSELLKEIKEEK